MATQLTDFGGLSNAGNVHPEAYTGLTTVDNATDQGEFEANRKDLRKPWILPAYKPPPVRPIG
jgi:hypothetical protein